MPEEFNEVDLRAKYPSAYKQGYEHGLFGKEPRDQRWWESDERYETYLHRFAAGYAIWLLTSNFHAEITGM